MIPETMEFDGLSTITRNTFGFKEGNFLWGSKM